MNIDEQRYYELVPRRLKEIVEQLKIANRLKAAEVGVRSGLVPAERIRTTIEEVK